MTPPNTSERSATSYQSAARGTRGASTVAVIGLTEVGLPLAILAATRSFSVIAYDPDEITIAQLAAREAAFLTEEETAAFKKSDAIVLTARESDLKSAATFIICVPNPTRGGRPDFTALEAACRVVGRVLKPGALVIVETTVYPGVCEEVVIPIIEKNSGLTKGDFLFAHCPERSDSGALRPDLASMPRVLGGRTPESTEEALAIYKTLLDSDVIVVDSLKEAEAVKMLETSFRDINIAFVNELAMAFDKANIDIINVINAASTRPGYRAFYPGCGFSDDTLPADPYHLIRFGRQGSFEHRFLATARRINDGMPFFTVRVLADALRQKRKSIKHSTIALLGLTARPDVPSTEGSPALVIENALQKKGARVRTFDPHAIYASTERTLEDAMSGVDAVVIATEHAAFCNLAPRDFEKAGIPIVIDGRNCLDKKAFQETRVLYRGIGR